MTQKHPSSLATDQAAQQWSYASGTSDTPLLGLTIGDMFDQTTAKYPRRAQSGKVASSNDGHSDRVRAGCGYVQLE